MRSVFKFISGIFLATALSCCSSNIKQDDEKVAFPGLPSLTISAELDSIVEIKNWLAIGPFEFNRFLTDPQKSFFKEDLKRFGVKEGLIDSATVEKLQRKGVNMFLINSPVSQIKFFNYIRGTGKNKSNFYLATRINSAKAQDVTLITDGSYSYAVWLNDTKKIEVKGKYNMNKAGDRFVNVSLKEGENIIFVKINRGTNERSWDLICDLAPRKEAERAFQINYIGDFVVNPIITGSFEVYSGPYSSGKIEVTNDKNQTVAAGSFDNQNTNNHPFVVSGFKKLEDGFYKVVLTVNGKKIEEMIYRGDYRKFVKKVKASVIGIKNDSLYSDDLKEAMKRIEFLNDKPGDSRSPSETRYLNRNRVFWGYSLFRMLQRNALTQLMTYKDKDNESGIFIFHIGRKRSEKVPLVIVVPYALQGNLMIEDWYTSNLDQIEADNSLADQYGFAIAWIYAGGKNYTSKKLEKEIGCIIDRLNLECMIDNRKIFITGDCEGGRRALLQLAATPTRYAACAVSAPITLSGGADGIPIDLLSQMGKVPIYIQHGTEDPVSPVENSRWFFAESQKLNMPVEYVEIQGSHASLSKDNHGYIYEFFSRIEYPVTSIKPNMR